VTRLRDPSAELVKAALELLRKELREATSSMTSVPKPMKFLGPHYAALKDIFNGMAAGDNKRASRCRMTPARLFGSGGQSTHTRMSSVHFHSGFAELLADIVSCLAMTMGKEKNESLSFKLLVRAADRPQMCPTTLGVQLPRANRVHTSAPCSIYAGPPR
jgi:hypothetical protein